MQHYYAGRKMIHWQISRTPTVSKIGQEALGTDFLLCCAGL